MKIRPLKHWCWPFYSLKQFGLEITLFVITDETLSQKKIIIFFFTKNMKQGLDCSSCYIRLYVVYGCCWLLVVYSYSVYDGPSKNITQLRPRGLTLAALKASEDGGGGSCFWIKHTLACMLVVTVVVVLVLRNLHNLQNTLPFSIFLY